jgi:peptidoglycan/xylan/chitin deacetylase (PgdA/CDA1 family)
VAGAAEAAIVARRAGWVAALAALLVAATGAAQTPARPPDRSWPFRGITGPDSATPIAPLVPTPWTRFAEGAPSRLAILLTDTASAWLGMAHALETIGVPFLITRDWSEAVRHRVVLVYPDVSGATLSADALRALAALPRSGGTLIANEVLVGGMNQVFGFDRALPARTRFELRFGTTSLTAAFTDTLERDIPLGDRAREAEAQWTVGYTGAADPIATFDDGTAAITRRVFPGGGRAIALGVDVGALCLLSHDGRDEYIGREYADGYEPVLDVFLRLLATIYATASPDAVTLGTVPDGRSLAVLLTHDIDYRYSLGNALAFAAWERSQGLRATYFVQTKYLTDWEDEGFFDSVAVTQVRSLDSMGMEIGSHTVAHARTFNTMPTGTGEERYPEYAPRILAATRTEGATVLGELRVSAFLLHQATGKPVLSFRPGYLRNPWVLPEALEATGYRYSSSFTADNALTHLPLHLNYDRAPGGELPLFDFPVTIEDEEAPPLMERLGAAVALARRLEAYGGTFVVLLHPNVIEPKLDFEKQLVDSLRPVAWFGTVGGFGAFWSARARTAVDVTAEGDDRVVALGLPEGATGLTVKVPAAWRLVGAEPAGARAAVTQAGVVVTAPPGAVRLVFRPR